MKTSLGSGFAAAKRFWLVVLLALAASVAGSRSAQGATAPKLPVLRLELSAESVPRVVTSAPAEAPASEYALEFSRSLQPPVYWEPLATGAGELESILNGTPLNLVPEALGFLRLRLSDAWLDQFDSDTDGLTDLLESRHPQFLSPLDPSDAAADWDRDGLSNRAEATLGSDLDDFSGQLAVVPERAWIVGPDGRLRGWESGVTGPPVPILGDWKWRQIATSGSHTLAVTRTGELWAWGENAGGELGTRSREPAASPVRIGSDSDWVQVAAGRGIAAGFSLGLRRDGSLWQWGEGLGITFPDPTSIPAAPKPVAPGQRWHCIQVGTEHAVAVNRDGSVWQWGVNYLGAFGPQDPELVELKEPTPVGADRDWRRLVAGPRFTLGIRRDGTLWGWGTLPTSLAAEPCALPIPLQTGWRWRTAAVVDEAVVAVREDGTLWAWGSVPTATGGFRSVTQPQALSPGHGWQALVAETPGFGAPSSQALARRADGTLWRISLRESGPSRQTRPWRVGLDRDWRAVSAGPGWSLATKHDGSLWTWGASPYVPPQGPWPDSLAALRPVEPGTRWGQASAGAGRGFAVALDGTLHHWGQTLRYFGGAWVGGGTIGGGNEHGSGGSGTWIPAESPAPIGVPQPYGPPSDWRQVEQGLDHGVGIRRDGTLWHWGLFPRPSRDTVETRREANVPVQVDAGTSWREVRAGAQHALALTTQGQLWSWGYNSEGQLGDGTRMARPTPVAIGSPSGWIAAAAGARHSLAVAADGTLWAWGGGDWGQLGVPGRLSSLAPMQVGSDADWVAVFAGPESSFALKQDGTLWAWGRNDEGQLGLGDTQSRTAPAVLESGQRWTRLSAGATHTLAVGVDGSLWAWGSCRAGQVPDDRIQLEPVLLGMESEE